jgi:hypothetical protein
MTLPVNPVRGRHFLWFGFFCASKGNELVRAAGETLLILAFACLSRDKLKQGRKGASQRLPPLAASFLLISVKRNGSKEKRFPVQS